MGIKEAYKRMQKEEDALRKYDDCVRMDKHSMLIAIRLCLHILEEECPEVLKEDRESNEG